MQTKTIKKQDTVSATGQFHWDTYTLWQQQVRHGDPPVKEGRDSNPGWDPYEVWQKRVKQGC